MAKGRGWAVMGSVVAALLGAGSAWGKVPPNAGERAAFAAFKRLDRDGNQSLDPAALSSLASVRQMFRVLDKNDDGTLSVADGEPARRLLRQAHARQLSPAQLSPRLLGALDTDGDGRLSLGEVRPSLAGNAPLPPTAPPARNPQIEVPQRMQPCWLHTPQGTWIQVQTWVPLCRQG